MPAPCFEAVPAATRRRPCGPPLALLVREPEAAYRPRQPERTALYRLFDRHFDAYARSHEERFPDPRQHLVRYYGSYANRARHMYRPAVEELDGGGAGGPDPDADADAESEFATERRQSWARLLRKILESLPRRSLGEGGSIRCCAPRARWR